jgi:uncharacterized membrane protein
MSNPLDVRATPERLLMLLDQDAISAETWERARELAGHGPTAKAWSRFLDRMLMLLGAALLLSGIVFFFASNWDRIGRLAEFAVLETALLLAVAFVAHEGTKVLSGKVALMGASILVGVLLGDIGASYNIQADAPEFFLAWAALITGWVIIGEWGPLWLLMMALLNLTVATYWTDSLMLILLIGLNATALAMWEFGDEWQVPWMTARWIPRVLAVVAVVVSVGLMLMFILADSYDFEQDSTLAWAWLAYLALTGGLAFGYYRVKPDLFMLTLCCAGLVIVSVAVVGKLMSWGDLEDDNLSTVCLNTLILGLLAIGETAGFVKGLMSLHQRWESQQ